MYLCARDIDIVSFYDFGIGILNCSDSMVFCAFHFVSTFAK